MPYQTLSLTSGLHAPGELLACWHEQTWSEMYEMIKVRNECVNLVVGMVTGIFRVGMMVRARGKGYGGYGFWDN